MDKSKPGTRIRCIQNKYIAVKESLHSESLSRQYEVYNLYKIVITSLTISYNSYITPSSYS